MRLIPFLLAVGLWALASCTAMIAVGAVPATHWTSIEVRFARWTAALDFYDDRPRHWGDDAYEYRKVLPFEIVKIEAMGPYPGAIEHSHVDVKVLPAVVLLFLVSLGLTVRALSRKWRWVRRLRSGHCANCGYDLIATDDRCPECSTPNLAQWMRTPASGRQLRALLAVPSVRSVAWEFGVLVSMVAAGLAMWVGGRM